MANYIRVIDVPANTPTHFFTDGFLFLELGDDFSLRLTQQAEAVNLRTIPQPAALPAGLPSTAINDWVLAQFKETALERRLEPLAVEVFNEDMRLPLDRLA